MRIIFDNNNPYDPQNRPESEACDWGKFTVEEL